MLAAGLFALALSTQALPADTPEGTDPADAICRVRLFDMSSDTPAPPPGSGAASALEQAQLLFDRVALSEIEARLAGLEPGAAREVSDLFEGDDSRWRFLRPRDTPGDADSFAIAPAQARWLIRPPANSAAAALLLAGLPGAEGGDAVAEPILVGLRAGAGPDDARRVFVIDPVTPADCAWRAGALDWVDPVLRG